MKKGLIILLLAEFLMAAVIGMTGHLDSNAHAQAWVAWHKNPTPENRAEFERQKRILGYENPGMVAVVFLTLAVPTWLLWRRRVSKIPVASQG